MTIKSRMAVALFALLTFCASADEVSSDVAEDAARGWINLREALGEEITAEPESVISYDAKDGKGKYYVVNLQGGGFVVTSGDTEIEPILAYSKDSTWNTNATQNPLMVMLNIDVAAMEEASTSSASSTSSGGRRLAAAAPSAKATKWARLRSAASAKGGTRLQAGSRSSINDVRVNTLMETKWGQSGHGENQYTPRGYVCGCVATAGAQIMRYWRYPTASITKIKDYYGTVDGTASWTLNDGYQTTAGGSYTAWNDDVKTFGGTYDWNNMPGTVSSWGMSTAQKKAIGKLTLDVGRSVYMDYASGGSGARYSAFHLRLTDQFGYKNSALKINPSADEIKKGILCSLDLKSPCGVSVPGHAIVADGYGYNSGTLYVHFNFGWTGTDNAWYNPPDLTDADSDFTSIDTIIYNIYPPSVCSDSGRTIVSGRLLNSSGSILANTTVTARNRSSGATYTATTDSKGIYALLVPAASYTISATKDNCTASTNLTVQACSSTRLASDDGSSYYSGGTVADIHGVELTLNQLPAPTFSPPASTFYTDTLAVTLACATAGATIRYTLDGSEPTSSSTAYSAPITISGTTTIKAKAFKSDYIESDTVSATYTMAEQAAAPTSTSTAGYRTTLVDLASTIPGAVIRYTTDGSDPTEQSEVYTAGTAINVTNATGATTIKARVYAEGYRPSDVFSYDYYVKRFFGPTNGVNAAVWEDTPQNRADHWIFENEEYQEATGLWSNAVEYVNHKVAIEERNEFTADNPSDARNVIVETTASFNSAAEENQEFTGVKAAVRIGTNACFQVYTTNLSGRVWLDTEGFTAIVGNDYTLRVEMDMTNRMYSVSVKQGVDCLPLTIDGKSTFPFAYDDVTPYVQKVGYVGEGAVGSIYGNYFTGFVAGSMEGLGKSITLTKEEADWLNGMGDYEKVKVSLDALQRDQFHEAYLLNSDFTHGDYLTRGWGTFDISGMSTDDEKVSVVVRLVRNFAVMDGAKEAPINGTLNVYGGDEIGVITNLQNAVEVSNKDFSSGQESTNTFNKAGVKLFYRAKIEPKKSKSE